MILSKVLNGIYRCYTLASYSALLSCRFVVSTTEKRIFRSLFLPNLLFPLVFLTPARQKTTNFWCQIFLPLRPESVLIVNAIFHCLLCVRGIQCEFGQYLHHVWAISALCLTQTGLVFGPKTLAVTLKHDYFLRYYLHVSKYLCTFAHTYTN